MNVVPSHVAIGRSWRPVACAIVKALPSVPSWFMMRPAMELSALESVFMRQTSRCLLPEKATSRSPVPPE